MYKFHCKTKYIDESHALLKVDRYKDNDRICLSAYSPTGELLHKCTVNIPELDITWDLVVIKNYSENAGILECLIKNEFITFIKDIPISQYANGALCQLNLAKIHMEEC